MSSLKKFNGTTWEDSKLRKLTTSTDTITTLPAVLYLTGTTATVGLKGNTAQSGTQTPDSPVMPQGTGERTGNLFDGNYTIAVMSVSGNTASLNTASSGRTAIVKCEPNTTYTVKKYSASNRFIIAESDIKPANGTAMSIIQNDSSISEYTFTTSNTTQYVAVYCSTSSEQAEPQLMFNLGATAFPYEPYGYKLDISSASTTTPVYLGEVETTRKIKKLVLTGEEAINGDVQYNRFIFTIQDMRSEGVRLTKLFCTHYQNISDGRPIANVPNNSIYTGGNTDSQKVFINTTDYTTVTGFKSYLAAQYANGTPVCVWYVLAEPTTGIVNEPLRKIGDYADTVSGITIPTITGKDTFDVLTTLKPSEVSLTYTGWHDSQCKEYDGSQWV